MMLSLENEEVTKGWSMETRETSASAEDVHIPPYKKRYGGHQKL